MKFFIEKKFLLKKIHQILWKKFKKFQKLNFFSKFHNFFFTWYFFVRLYRSLVNVPKYYWLKKFFRLTEISALFFLHKKRAFFSMKNFKKFQKNLFFFKVLELFIYLILFHGTEVWGKVHLKVLFFEKKNNQISNLKNFFFSIFSKGYTSEKIWIFFQFWSNFFEKFFVRDVLFHK